MDHQGLLRGARLSHLVPGAGWAGGAPPPDHLGRAAHGRAGACGASAVLTAVLVGVGGGGCRAPPASRADPERGVQEKVARIQQDKESVNIQHEEDCQKLQDELELQKSKEEKQRALLQLQWKVMGENQQVDQAMSSKKRRDSYVRKESRLQLAGPETKRKDVKLPGVIQSPISTAMRKVEKGTQDVPNHRKVTHHEYEVETANGRITKRRKTTKSTVMFGVARIQQDNELKESSLRSYHKEELQRIRSQSENELKERLSSLRQKHEAQINSVNIQHEEDCQKLQDELELQKSKEEKQRALLMLQWKVMGENQQVDQEVSSKKRRDSYVRKESQVQLAGPETKRKDVKLPGVIQSPISTAMRKVEKGTQNVPNHRKVTHHEYEVETANGRITKRRKTTKSTVMFGEPNTQKSLHNTYEKDVTRTRKTVPGSRPHPANIGELFSEGSLNPYAEDPYAFG